MSFLRTLQCFQWNFPLQIVWHFSSKPTAIFIFFHIWIYVILNDPLTKLGSLHAIKTFVCVSKTAGSKLKIWLVNIFTPPSPSLWRRLLSVFNTMVLFLLIHCLLNAPNLRARACVCVLFSCVWYGLGAPSSL